jgi:Na+-transporting NADH:ubiquinone oxidoreductase subunit C
MPAPDRKNSVPYILGFAVAVCLACAMLVATAAVGLKPLQDKNARVDRLTRVLEVAGLIGRTERLSAEEVIRRFEEHIEPRIVELESGEYNDGAVDPATYDPREAASDPSQSRPAPRNEARVRRLPINALVYHVKKEGQVEQVILPIRGYGLWSTMYGYLAMKRDGRTISGITFYEHGETPGLGGEIENPRWQAKWPGRKAYGPGGEVRIEVVKGAVGPPEEAPHSVDGLSGATITSRGVTNTLDFWLGEHAFGPYLDKFRTHQGAST